MSHAQILVGEGEAVRARALVLAKGANCLNSNDESSPCNTCKSCNLFDAGNHPDTFYVVKTDRASIGVDDVREQVIAPMSTKPYSYNYKVFIVDHAETLTPAAQSALLKTIEEPAPYGFFLFLAPNEHNFLPTILSRCFLHKISGSPPEQRTGKMQEFAKQIADTAHTWDILTAFAMYRGFDEYKEKEALQRLLDEIYLCYGRKISSVEGGAQPPQFWLNATKTITKTKQILSQNGNTQLAIELMLTDLRNTE